MVVQHLIILARSFVYTYRLLVFAVWFVGVTVPISYLMASHYVPLATSAAQGFPAPTRPERAVWSARHILGDQCPCSGVVAVYLIHRKALPGVDETVYLCGGDPTELDQQLTQSGFKVQRISPEHLLKSLGVVGGPWLEWLRPDGSVAYSGGYASQRPVQGIELSDIAILRQLKTGKNVVPLPAYGCAIDPQLRRTMDPLNVKYR